MSAPGMARVLLADDDALVREIADAMLASYGFEVQTVGSGEEAVRACAARLPDIALLDVDMPGGNGYDACAAIRAMPGGETLPIVMVTGLDDSSSIDHAYEVGATDFVGKPINWVLLAHRIRYVLRGARTLDALRLSEQKNSALIRAIPDGIYLLDCDGGIGHCFRPLEALGALAAGDAPTRRFIDMLPASARALARDALATTLRGAAQAFEFTLGEKAEKQQYFECRYLPNAAGDVLAIVRDISARKVAEARIHRLAYYDVLTDLPNREWLGEYLSRSLADAQVDGRSVALLYVDLDQFKRINDTLGHDTGDSLLRQVARRLAHALELACAPKAGRLRGHLARVGGDEFIAVLTGDASLEDAERAADLIRQALSAPLDQSGYQLVVTPSIGIALFPEHGDDAQSLLKHADSAMYEAKSGGRNQHRVYTSALNARAVKRLSLEMELRRAIEDAQLEVHYQPKYDAHNLRILGAEALLRWTHPRRGCVPTSDFIAVAEETGLIGELDRWALSQVCRDILSWRAAGLEPPSIAVNLSGSDFMQPDSPARICDTVERAALPAALFELELTEGVLMRDAEGGRRSLLALKEFGFALAIDDFGTGYSSLSYLRRFPLDTLKIDRSFVEDITADADDAAIVRAIIALGHNLGLKIVAEGVATEDQLRFLQAERCDALQGFLLSAAIPAPAFAARLAAETSRAAALRQDPIPDHLVRRAG
jgi:diguanylate cyclase (GGDEF)-like protein